MARAARTNAAAAGLSQARSAAQSEKGLNKLRVVSELAKAPHGNLDEYLPIGLQAASEDPDFYAHLVAWNEERGQVRDAKLALPVIQLASLRGEAAPEGSALGALRENSLAHLAKQSPRDLVRALKWAKGKVAHRHLAAVVKRYIRERERRVEWWDRTVLAHRGSMIELYKFFRIAPSTLRASKVLFEGDKPPGSVFEALGSLSSVTLDEAAALIINHRLPFLSVQGALGKRAKDPAIGLALIERMSPTQLVTNTKMLESMGMATSPEMRAAYEAKLAEVAKSKKASLKAGRAAKVLTEAGEASETGKPKVAEKLAAVQEKQLDAMGVKGNWLVLADKSGSMQMAIEAARHVAAVLARVAQGDVHLVFFDISPLHLNVTGLSYEKISGLTALVSAVGGTSIGCGLALIMEKDIDVDGIAIVSDAAENTPPMFATVYGRYCEKVGKNPPVYLYRFKGGDLGDHYLDLSMRRAGYDMQEFDLRGGIDHTSLPNLVLTMRTNRYGLIDEIMQTPLLTMDSLFRSTNPHLAGALEASA